MTNLTLEEFENGVKVYQNEKLYKFTSDAIKLAKFCNIKQTDNVLDLCAGCGVVGFYAYSIKKFNKIYFNDIQLEMCELIKQNIKLNRLEEKSKVVCKNLKDLKREDFETSIDVIICNPPYFKLNGKIKTNHSIAMCRHELTTNLSQVVNMAGKLIKSCGRFYIVVPADRLCECIIELNKSKFEVKKIQVCYSGENATVCLMESIKGGKSGVKVMLQKEII